MTAREMFENLGYKQSENSSNYIVYKYNEFDMDVPETYSKTIYRIVFIKRKKLIQICNDNGSYFITCDKRLVQAINKQVEELGWNNES